MKKEMLLTCVLFFASLLPAGETVSSDWAFFRGDAAGCGVVASPASSQKIQPQKLQLLWKRSLEAGWFEASPIIAGGTVFIGNSEDSLDAFDLRSGTPQWHYPLKLGTTTPAVWYNGAVFIVDGENTLHAVDATSGERRWSVPITGSVDQSPNIFGDTLLVASQSGELLAFDTASGERRGVWKGQDQLRCSPTWTNGTVFLGGCDGHLHVVSIAEKTITVHAQSRHSREGGNLDNTPQADAPATFAQANLIALALDPRRVRGGDEVDREQIQKTITFKELASIDLDSPTGSTVAIRGNLAVVGTEGNELLGVDWRRGVVAWRFESRQPFRAPAAVRDELAVVGGHDRIMYGIDLTTGTKRWEYATKGRIEGGAVLVGDAVLFGGSDSRLVLLDAATGALRDSVELDGKVVASVAIADGIAVIGTQNGVLYAFKL